VVVVIRSRDDGVGLAGMGCWGASTEIPGSVRPKGGAGSGWDRNGCAAKWRRAMGGLDAQCLCELVDDAQRRVTRR
jgi:hypothetical protein